jgi:DNA-binding YbaB/EbfC family protein
MAPKSFLRGGLPELVRQARRVQDRLDQIKEELKTRTETVTMADGKLAVTVNGEKRVTAVKIDPQLVREEDLAMVEDLLIGAVNAALEKMDAVFKEETEKVTGGVDLPGLL